MEQKRILWIAASVGIFLLVVVGAALILYSPPRADSSLSQEALQDNTWMRVPDAQTGLPQQAGLPQQNGAPQQTGLPQQTVPPQQPDVPQQMNLLPQSVPPVMPASTESAAAVSGAQAAVAPQTSGGTFVTPSEGVTVITDNTRVISTGGVTTIDLSTRNGSQTGTAVAAAPPAVAPAPQPAVSAAAPSAPAKPAVSQTTPPAPSAPKPPSPAASAPPVSAVSAKKPIADQYWVQAASYSSKKNADNAREALMANKIPCEVFTYTDSKGVHYRVRVGPYTTKSEAEYWQSRVSQIKEFADSQSYVTNATAKAQ